MEQKILKLIQEWNKNLTKSQKMNISHRTTGGICAFCMDIKQATLFVPYEYKDILSPVWTKWTMICPNCLPDHLKRLAQEKMRIDTLTLMIKDFKDSLIKKNNKKTKK